MSTISDITGDASWHPEVPIGHTGYTWGTEGDVEAEDTSSPAATTESGIRVPIKGEKNILITSALPYVNNIPHLGNIIGCVLSADVYARFCRLRNYNSLYVCGTDEYGTATEIRAQLEGITPQEICDKYFKLHSEVYEWFDISFDHFGRTTTPKQTVITQDIFNKCDSNGYIHPEPISQLYCGSCERALADRFVAGTCPLCNYDDAKGDQCDKCSQIIVATELINPKCTVCNATPTIRNSEHLFIDLPKISPKLEEFVRKNSEKWSDNSVTVTNTWLKNGLKSRCITRDLKWGTAVPKEGFEDKVFYVWFDAPIGYISITANYTDDWEKWWKNPDDVELVQFMGKDNVPFHTVIFPSTCIAADDNYTLLSRLSTTEYLNYEGTKFSKTRGVGVFGNQAMDTGIPAEVWRYYLLYNRPEQSDTMFLWEDFASKANVDLPNSLGNLVQRSLSFIASRFDSTIPVPLAEFGELEIEFEKTVSGLVNEYIQQLDKIQIKDALKTAISIAFHGNKYMQTTKPWELHKTNIEQCSTVLFVIAQLVKLLSVLFEPMMPSFSRIVLGQLQTTFPTKAFDEKKFKGWNLSEYARISRDASIADNISLGLLLRSGHKIGTPVPIFKKIEATQIEELRKKYSGLQNQASVEEGAEFPLTIVTGTVQEVKDHPSNPKLYVLSVSSGDEKPRQIVSNLVSTHTPEQLLQKKVLLLTNIKYGKFGGVLSEGMLMTAVHVTDQESKPVPLAPVDLSAVDGTKVIPKGCKLAPVKAFDVKKKIAELQLTVGQDSKILFSGVEWLINGDCVVADQVPEGSRVC